MAFSKLYFADGVFESSVVEGVGIIILEEWLGFETGEMVEAVCAEDDRFLLRIVNCIPYCFFDIPEKEVWHDGFIDYRKALDSFNKSCPDLAPQSVVSVIRFEVITQIDTSDLPEE